MMTMRDVAANWTTGRGPCGRFDVHTVQARMSASSVAIARALMCGAFVRLVALGDRREVRLTAIDEALYAFLEVRLAE